MTTEEKIRYATWLSRVGLLHSGAVKQSCLASGKITTEVLRSLNIPARPVTATVLAATEGWVKRMERTGPPASPEELEEWWTTDRAYSVGVMHDSEPDSNAWTAHLVVLAGPGHSYLVDPSADQLARPQFDLPVTPLVFDMGGQTEFNQHEFRRGRTQAVSYWQADEQQQGFVIVHSIFPADRSFRDLNDFRLFEYRYGDMARSIVTTLKDMDEAGLTGDSLPPLPELPDAPDDPVLKARPRAMKPGRIRQTAQQ